MSLPKFRTGDEVIVTIRNYRIYDKEIVETIYFGIVVKYKVKFGYGIKILNHKDNLVIYPMNDRDKIVKATQEEIDKLMVDSL